MNKHQQSLPRIERTHEETHRTRRQANAGAPPLECNLWLEEELKRIGSNQHYRHLYKPWLEHYYALRGFYPADPRRSFRAAVSGSLKRLRSRHRS